MKLKNIAKKAAAVTAALAVSGSLISVFAVQTFAYDRDESTVVSGGTVITVYAGEVYENSDEPYLEADMDYVSFSRYRTAGKVVSESNMTSPTNFVDTVPAYEEGTVAYGGVEGVSFDGATNTLTLENAQGTVIAVTGPTIDPAAYNTYNDKLSLVIDKNSPNLTSHYQDDAFGGKHWKDNKTVQDEITINLVGENSFDHIAAIGNVKITFVGDGTLTLDAGSKEWQIYDKNENDPKFDPLSVASDYAFASVRTIGYNGILEGEDVKEETFPNGMARTLTEKFVYALPEIVLGEGVSVEEGGDINNSTQLAAANYFTFTGEAIPEAAIEGAQDLGHSGNIFVGDTQYPVTYNDDASVIYLIQTVQQGMQQSKAYYDISQMVERSQPFSSFIGENGVPAQKVTLKGTVSAESEIDSLIDDIADVAAEEDVQENASAADDTAETTAAQAEAPAASGGIGTLATVMIIIAACLLIAVIALAAALAKSKKK